MSWLTFPERAYAKLPRLVRFILHPFVIMVLLPLAVVAYIALGPVAWALEAWEEFE